MIRGLNDGLEGDPKHERYRVLRDKLLQSLRRILLATCVAISATAIVALALLFVHPNIAFGFVLLGIRLYATGMADRPLLSAVGGVLMFGAVFSWAVRQ